MRRHAPSLPELLGLTLLLAILAAAPDARADVAIPFMSDDPTCTLERQCSEGMFCPTDEDGRPAAGCAMEAAKSDMIERCVTWKDGYRSLMCPRHARVPVRFYLNDRHFTDTTAGLVVLSVSLLGAGVVFALKRRSAAARKAEGRRRPRRARREKRSAEGAASPPESWQSSSQERP